MNEGPQEPGRRKLLILGLAVTGATALGGGGWALWRWRRFKELAPGPRKLAWFMAGRIAALQLDMPDEFVQQWVEDHERLHGKIDEGKAKRAQVQSLILSTNLLTRTGDEAPAYLSYYDPHKNPCYNPLRDVSRERG